MQGQIKTGAALTVRVHNDVNRVAFTGFSKRELSIFYSIVCIVDDRRDEELMIPFGELQKMMDGRFANREEFLACLSGTVQKLLSLQTTICLANGNTVYFVPFTVFEIMEQVRKLRVRVNPEFLYLFNMLQQNFTAFGLVTLYQLKTKYSQRLFTCLMQYKKTGTLYLPIDEFRRVMDIPASYTHKKIGAKILSPAVEELGQHFKDFHMEKIRTGRTITALRFTFSGLVEEEKEPQHTGRPVKSEETVLHCPRCGGIMVRRINKMTGEAFYGHAQYKGNPCTVTYSSREALEADRAAKRQAETEKEMRGREEHRAWANVLAQQKALFSRLHVDPPQR